MKKVLKKICVIIAAAAVLVGSAVPVFAAGNVTYDGNAKEFIFKPGSEESPTDLFENFKNVMPGDELTEEITVKNKADNPTSVRIYLRALGAQKNTAEFLNQMNLKVEANGTKELFNAPAGNKGQLSDWVSLGEFAPGAEVTLKTTLTVPVEVDNEYADDIGYLDWQFKVEEIVNPTPAPTPITGDPYNFVPFVIIIVAAVAVVVIILVVRRKRRKD